jgi:DNA-binding PadR family transcriptional regulator
MPRPGKATGSSSTSARSGRHLASGNLYRELARLTAHGFVTGCADVPSEDPRRVPYRITDAGRKVFDGWLTSSKTLDDELEVWLAFLDRVPSDALGRLLDRQLELLWASGKRLAELREDTARADPEPHAAFSAWLSLRTRRVAADVEFLQELHDRLVRPEHACPHARAADVVDAAPVRRLAPRGRARG